MFTYLSPGTGTVGRSTRRFRPTKISQFSLYLRKGFILFRPSIRRKISRLYLPWRWTTYLPSKSDNHTRGYV